MEDRQTFLEEKGVEIQQHLEWWAVESSILDPGEQIVFSLHIKKMPTVVQEEGDKDLLAMYVSDFFTDERAKQAGVGHATFSVNPICTGLYRAGASCVGDVLEIERFARQMGLGRFRQVQAMLQTVGLSLSERLLEKMNAAKKSGNLTVIPEEIVYVPLTREVDHMPIKEFFNLERARSCGIQVRGSELAHVYNPLCYMWPSWQFVRFRSMKEVLGCSAVQIREILGEGPVTNALFWAMLESAGLKLRG